MSDVFISFGNSVDAEHTQIEHRFWMTTGRLVSFSGISQEIEHHVASQRRVLSASHVASKAWPVRFQVDQDTVKFAEEFWQDCWMSEDQPRDYGVMGPVMGRG